MSSELIIINPKEREGIEIDRNNQIIVLKNQNKIYFDIEEYELKKDKSLKAIWHMLGQKSPQFRAESSHITFNQKYIASLIEKRKQNQTSAYEFDLTFTDFYAGGGFAYLELFEDGKQPKNRIPNGWFVQRKYTPKIAGVEWRSYGEPLEDSSAFKDSTHGYASVPITGKIGFNSWVQLHIYTHGLFGRQLRVKLFDEGFWFWEGETLKPIEPKFGFLPRTLIYHVAESKSRVFHCNTPLEPSINSHGLSDKISSIFMLNKVPYQGEVNFGLENTEDLKTYFAVQSAVVDVFIPEYFRNFFDADDVNLTPIIEYFDDDSDTWKSIEHDKPDLKLSTHYPPSIGAPKSGLSPQMVDSIATDYNSFKPCHYTKIEASVEGGKNPLIYFNQNEGIDFTYAPLQIVVGESEPKNITIKLDAQTDECFHDDNAQKDHQGHVIKFLSLKNEGMTALVPPTDSQVSWNQFHPKPSLDEIIKGIWLPNIQPIKHQINFTTCRHQKKMDIEIYPALEYTFNAHIGVAEDEYLYVKQTKNYQKRVYKGKKKDGTKTAKKTYNKNRKEAYLGEVDSKVTGDNFMQKYQLSYGVEFSFDGDTPIELELETADNLVAILNGMLYVYGLIDSYLFGSKLKAAEEGRLDDNGEINQNTTVDNEQKRKFKNSQEKRKKKKFGKEALKGPLKNLPLRFTVDPPKLTGGVTWSYAQSQLYPTQIGANYEFVLGALPLVKVEGRLDLLFAAQFIPYLGQVIKAIDKILQSISKAGEFMEFFGMGNMEADYYFDLVCEASLEIDVVSGATYHTIDGFTSGTPEVLSPLSVKLEAGGYIIVEIFKLKAEALIHAEAEAKFEIQWKSDDKEFASFIFEGIEAQIYTKFEIGRDTDPDNDKNDDKVEEAQNVNSEKILDGFSIEIPLFSFSSK